MLTGRPLYGSPSDKSFKMMEKGGIRDVVTAYEGCGLTALSPAAKDLIYGMLDADPTKRPTLEQLLEFPCLAPSKEEDSKMAAVAVTAAGAGLDSPARMDDNINNRPMSTSPVAW